MSHNWRVWVITPYDATPPRPETDPNRHGGVRFWGFAADFSGFCLGAAADAVHPFHDIITTTTNAV